MQNSKFAPGLIMTSVRTRPCLHEKHINIFPFCTLLTVSPLCFAEPVSLSPVYNASLVLSFYHSMELPKKKACRSHPHPHAPVSFRLFMSSISSSTFSFCFFLLPSSRSLPVLRGVDKNRMPIKNRSTILIYKLLKPMRGTPPGHILCSGEGFIFWY